MSGVEYVTVPKQTIVRIGLTCTVVGFIIGIIFAVVLMGGPS